MNHFEPEGLGLSIFDFAWAAGFWEADGCVTLSHGNPTITIAQVEPVPLHRFQGIVRVGKVNGPYSTYEQRDSFANAKPQYKFQCSAIEEVRHIAKLLSPHLTVDSPKTQRLITAINESAHVVGRKKVLV